ncbi:amidohydrolase [Idiomarina loihiensis]|uniref:amidohydrolase n=1 Tax=Idiomarina loihiensis TaxID=135577 RepID=UPI00129CED6C|nr:amidohydrolase [Idiomarina loihiensis]MRJ45923.1 amidohydrolase family protein [Idiomarina loihiensis]UTW32013.1 amidohydrolase [Idiomarina loihiensis]
MRRIICLFIGLGLSASAIADTLYTNMKGYTLTSPAGEQAVLQQFSTMLVENGKIQAIGGNALAERFTDTEQTVDMQGKTVLPGLTDAHGHIQSLGTSLLQVDLRDTDSVSAAVKKVHAYAGEQPEMEWITGRGWNQEQWQQKVFPSAAHLDEVVNDRPVWLMRVDAHAGWANSEALRRAGIDKDTVAPEGGEIVRDEQGNPTGVLVDNAMQLVEDVIPEPSLQQQRAAYELAFEHLIKLGITSVHDAGINADEISVYKGLHNQGRMPLRVYGMIAATEPKLAQLLAEGPYESVDQKLTIRSVKIYADGALGSRGAALLEDYSDDHGNHGLMVTSEEKIRDLYELIIPHGFQINTHAIGDRANRVVLDNLAEVYNELGGRNLRNRIEHAQIVHPDDLKRFNQLNLVASMQPTHATSDKNMAEDRLGAARMEGAYAWQTLLDQGTVIAAGSDFPVELANPFYGLHAAVTRQDRNDMPAGGWYAEEKMSLQQALRSFTIDAAYSAWQEKSLGSLEPGKWADFIVVEQDPFAVDASDIWRTQVEQTYVAGERVY